MISIIIPTYNRASLLSRTLNSIKSQTSSNWECIVVDDSSTDNTKEVVDGLVACDSRFSYLRNTHQKGAQGARNTGLEHAKSEWVVFFDSDNIMHDNFVVVLSSKISRDFDVIACCSDIVDVATGRTGRVMNPNCHGIIHDRLFQMKCYVDFNQAIIRKEKLFEISELDEACPSMQEWDTHIRLSKFSNYTMVEDSLVDYFQGGKDAISSNTKREVIGRLYILRKHLDEWKKHQVGLTSFCYQIYNLICKNDDAVFVEEKTKELRSLVPFCDLRLSLMKIWHKIRY